MFEQLTDEDIDEVQRFVRERFLTILKSRKTFDESESNMTKYFGPEFASCPDQFKFQIGDLKLIKIIQSHVKKELQEGKKFTQIEIIPKENKSSKTKPLSDDGARTYFFLNKLQAAADLNSNRKKGGYRYESDVKLFAAYLRTIVGKLGYETIEKNLPCALPSLPSTNRYIQASTCKVYEGILRSEELLIHLMSRNLPLAVSLSEDGTRIVGRIQYCSVTNQIVGFTLPTKTENGMPIPFSFPAKNAQEILSHFNGQNAPANFLNIVMAQPLGDVPPFCLLMYGSDNKYDTTDVINRWTFIIADLKRVGIAVLTFSSDSATPYNAAMRYLSHLGSTTNFLQAEWFSCGNTNNGPPFYVQDMVHIGTKSRNFLLRTILDRKIVPFGSQNIAIKYLFELLLKFPKDMHELTPTVLNPNDRQNFDSVRRITHPKVIDLLKRIKNSEATAHFLEMIGGIIDSYLDPDLFPLDRIRKIWYAIFVFRIWKKYISKSKKYKVDDNFLTANCYSCIELNGHSLVQLMLYLKENGTEEQFLPQLFGSQQCESTFRQLRSLTSTYSTVTNCTVKEALSRVNKIQFQNEVMHLTSSKFHYPRLASKKDASKLHTLPSQSEIIDTIEKCKYDAIQTAVAFNLISSKSTSKTKTKATSCTIQVCTPRPKKKYNWNDVIPIKKSLCLSDFKNIALKNYAYKKNESIDESSPYIEFNFNSNRIVVKKTSFCWLLREEVHKLSNDRLLRVQGNPGTTKKNTQRVTRKNATTAFKKNNFFFNKRKF